MPSHGGSRSQQGQGGTGALSSGESGGGTGDLNGAGAGDSVAGLPPTRRTRRRTEKGALYAAGIDSEQLDEDELEYHAARRDAWRALGAARQQGSSTSQPKGTSSKKRKKAKKAKKASKAKKGKSRSKTLDEDGGAGHEDHHRRDHDGDHDHGDGGRGRDLGRLVFP